MILEKITDEEIDLIDVFFYPVGLAETLFSNVETLKEFQEDKLIDIRISQYAMLPFGSMLDDNCAQTEKEVFDMRKKASELYCYGGRGFGKCEYIENNLLLSDGRYVKFKDVVNSQQRVISFNDKTLKFENSIAKIEDNGIQDCFKIKLKSGREIILTENHPLYTNYGWKEVKDLKEKDFIGISNGYNIKGKINHGKEIAKLLGYLLGDSGTSIKYNVHFTNTNLDIIKDLQNIVEHFNCYLKFKGEYLYKINSNDRQNNQINKIVEKYKINCLSKNKEIPQEVFLWKNEQIALLLNRLFACDGTVGHNIEICLASKKMILQIQSLLLRFGIRSNFSYKKSFYRDKLGNKKYFDAWRLSIYRDYDKFLIKIGVFTKDDVNRKNKSFSSGDLVPANLIKDIYKDFKFKKKLNLRKLLIYSGTTREKLQKINKVENNQDLEKFINSDVYWDTIKKIEYIGKLPTVSLYVPKNNSYISNDIISHNSVCAVLISMLIEMVYADYKKYILSSFDGAHLRTVMDNIAFTLKWHPFFQMFKATSRATPEYVIDLNNGFHLDGVNMDTEGGEKNAGEGFVGKHAYVIYMEEASRETHTAKGKKVDAVSPYGCIARYSGMTDFSASSPAGENFYSDDKQTWIMNVPQYIDPNWNEQKKQEKMLEYGGEQELLYRIFVKGEIVEDMITVFDMPRIRENCYNKNKIIKIIEISKENFDNFEYDLIVERAVNAEKVLVSADIGDIGQTAISIFELINDRWRYKYNVVIYGLPDDEQEKIFKKIVRLTKADYLGIDITDGTGRAVTRRLEKSLGAEVIIIPIHLKEKIEIGIRKDENDCIVYENGKPVLLYEDPIVQAVKVAKDYLYKGKFEIPRDARIDKQLSAVVTYRSKDGLKTVYRCGLVDDHLYQSWQVAFLMLWKIEYGELQKNETKEFFGGILI